MAQRVQVILVDDVDGGEASETVTFALDGTQYEIDLSTDHATALREDFGKWIGHARRSAGRKAGAAPTRRSGAGSTRRSDLNEIREWGRANGFTVSNRGRVSRELQDAYDKTQDA